MQRELTFIKDKLPAISGVAKHVWKKVRFEYRAGIWLEDIHFGLSWFVEGESEREKTFVAPSWSWASIRTPIDGKNQGTKAYHAGQYHRGDHSLKDDQLPMELELIDCELTPRGKDLFGQITHAGLVLRGLLLELSKWKARSPIHIGTSFPQGTESTSYSICCNFDEPSTTHHYGEDTLVHSGAHILNDLYLLHIYGSDRHPYESCFLILRPTTTEGEFHRVGLARAETDELEAAGEWNIREVTIV